MSEKESRESIFIKDQSFNNVYFIKVDAAGHSDIVRNNTEDKVNMLFDLFEKAVYAAVESCKKKNNCNYAEFWGWQGDGGLCVIYDKSETISVKTSISSACTILA